MKIKPSSLAIAAQRVVVLALPCRSRGRTFDSAVARFAEATMLAAGGGEAAQLAVLVHRVAKPVDARVIADAGMLDIHQDNLKEFVRGVLKKRVCGVGEWWLLRYVIYTRFTRFLPSSPSMSSETCKSRINHVS